MMMRPSLAETSSALLNAALSSATPFPTAPKSKTVRLSRRPACAADARVALAKASPAATPLPTKARRLMGDNFDRQSLGGLEGFRESGFAPEHGPPCWPVQILGAVYGHAADLRKGKAANAGLELQKSGRCRYVMSRE